MKKIVGLLIVSLTGCQMEFADSQDFEFHVVAPPPVETTKPPNLPLPPPPPLPNPLPEYPYLLKSTMVHSWRCTSFAIGPREIMTAAHCLYGEQIMVHPVTGSNITIYVQKMEFTAGQFDRAKLTLPEGSPNMKYWFELDTPKIGERALVVGKRNQHYLPVTVEAKRFDGIWALKNDQGEDVSPGDSGAPVVSISTGKVIGIISHYGPMMTPVDDF